MSKMSPKCEKPSWTSFALYPALVSLLVMLFFYITAIKCNFFQYFMENYRNTLRGNFFNGFLTLGSLLWAVKSFIISNLKKDYIENQLNDENFIDSMKTLRDSTSSKIDYSIFFYPLVNLSRSLFVSIASSLCTAVIQITVGSIKSPYATLVAFGSIGFTLTILTITLYYVNLNYSSWMDQATINFNKNVSIKIDKKFGPKII